MEPPHKKRRLSIAETSLSLPSLDLSPKHHSSHTIINDLSLSFELDENDKESSTDNKVQKVVKSKKKRRGMGPVCSACNQSMNPCDAYIKCMECEGVILCIECFKSGREFASHKRFHRYSVLNPLYEFKLPIKGSGESKENEEESSKATKRSRMNHRRWTANDEWNLLDGMLLCTE